jgi:SAM-dependent methyltransferase
MFTCIARILAKHPEAATTLLRAMLRTTDVERELGPGMGDGLHGAAVAVDLRWADRPKESVMGARGKSFPASPEEAMAADSPLSVRNPATQFAIPAEQYERFMGRYVPTLGAALVDAAGVMPGMRALDVGCGPGGLTSELCRRVGAHAVAAIDPAPQFVAACRERHRSADVREGIAEQLPWPDGEFHAALSCLVIGFMSDPDRGVREMARVTRPGGTVAACMWDIGSGGMTMLRMFWSAVRQLEPGVEGERRLAGAAEGDIAARFARAGLQDVAGGALTASADYAGFDDFWEPFTYGIGPSGQYLASLPETQRARVCDACRAQLPDGPFSLQARAWYARGTVPRSRAA